jgi:hypothetical protein
MEMHPLQSEMTMSRGYSRSASGAIESSLEAHFGHGTGIASASEASQGDALFFFFFLFKIWVSSTVRKPCHRLSRATKIFAAEMPG